ncbi:MAG: D-cysteine desulfhydrase family protein [Chthonomonadales bacterium]
MDLIHLASLPTPLQPAVRLSDRLGIDLYFKRDDLTGFAMGGNKVRKAEYLLVDATTKNADTLITAGAVQSNHARVIAAAAKVCGMDCHLVLAGDEPEAPNGNLLLDILSHATIHFVPKGTDRAAVMESLAVELSRTGRRPYIIPIGGSNAVGAQGYVQFMQELKSQLDSIEKKPNRLVFATSSGGTYGGILAGKLARGLDIELLGVRVDDDPGAEEEIERIARESLNLAGISEKFGNGETVNLDVDHVGEGYGIPTEAGLAAVHMVWETEGILLDPVYSGKAMSAVFTRATRCEFANDRIIFLHTGGGPSVFANSAMLIDK